MVGNPWSAVGVRQTSPAPGYIPLGYSCPKWRASPPLPTRSGATFLMDFTFNAMQLPGLIVLAESRNTFKAGARSRNRKIAKAHSDFEVMLAGLMGEYAVGKTLDVAIDVHHHQGGDGGKDLIYKSQSVQVKTSSMDKLIFNKDDRALKADIAILTQVVGPCRVRMHGWITAELFRINCYQHDFGYGERDVVDANNLQSMESLLEMKSDVDNASLEVARREMHVMKRRLESRVSR